jgi:hypothetical protein
MYGFCVLIYKSIKWFSVNWFQASIQILKAENEQKEKERDRENNDINDVFKKPLNPANYGKYNPLHWSAYKGNILITSILIILLFFWIVQEPNFYWPFTIFWHCRSLIAN